MEKTITAPVGAKYLSEFLDELPVNCILNKSTTGCGGTTLALTNEKKFVIVVPYSALVENKIQQTDGVLGVHSGVTIYDIAKYVSNGGTKIMVTWDSLYKVHVNINPKEWSLLIDEYQLLFAQNTFRGKAINYVLEHFREYKDFTFISATPIPDEFVLEELKNVPVVTIEWPNLLNVKLDNIQVTGSLITGCCAIIDGFLSGRNEGNLYIFVNSVSFINDILEEYPALTEENTRLIYSKNSKEVLRLPNGSTTDQPKKFNFITSTAFEGCDIYDENGRSLIISTDFSKIDTATTMIQVAGRIRNSQYKDHLMHLFKETSDNDVDYILYKERRCKAYNSPVLDAIVEEVNSQPTPKERREAYKTYRGTDFLIADRKGFIKKDINLLNRDLFTFYLVHCVYNDTKVLNSKCEEAGFTVDGTKVFFEGTIKKHRLTFAECCQVLREIPSLTILSATQQALIDTINYRYPFLRDAISKLGWERIASLSYCIKSIKAELIASENGTDAGYKVFRILRNEFTVGEFVSLKDAKKLLQSAYFKVGLSRTAKASDLENYFEVQPICKRIDGKPIQGYTVICSNYRQVA